jgi:hypothetical protein
MKQDLDCMEGGGAFNPSHYDFHMTRGEESLVRYDHQNWRMKYKRISFLAEELMHPNAVGIAVKKEYIAAGGLSDDRGGSQQTAGGEIDGG